MMYVQSRILMMAIQLLVESLTDEWIITIDVGSNYPTVLLGGHKADFEFFRAGDYCVRSYMLNWIAY